MRSSILVPLFLVGQLAYAQAPGKPPTTPPKPGTPAAPGKPGTPAPPGKPGQPAVVPPGGAPPATPPPATPPPKAPSLKDDPKFQEAVWQSINGTASAIDNCSSRYTTEFPDRKGKVEISIKVGPDGKVTQATINTSLQSPDRIKECMSAVARHWRFAKGPFDLSVPVSVAKDHKFRLKKPGEKDPPPAKGAPPAPPDEGFIKFLPSYTE